MDLNNLLFVDIGSRLLYLSKCNNNVLSLVEVEIGQYVSNSSTDGVKEYVVLLDFRIIFTAMKNTKIAIPHTRPAADCLQ